MEKDTKSADTTSSDSDRADGDISADGMMEPRPQANPEKQCHPATHEELAPPPNPSRVPDGGLQAWLQVLGAIAILVNTWGLINTFGVYQAYYETSLLKSHSSSEISWIGSCQGALLFFVGVIAGPLYDRGYFRHLLIVGMFLIVFGQFMTSLCTTYWQVLLAQGFTIGIGMGMTFLPSAAIMSQYFDRRRALALGISSVGSPIAGAIFPIIFSRLEKSVGFGWATRVIAFILLGTSIVPIVFMRTRVPPSGKGRAIIDLAALRDAPYVLFVTGCFFGFLALYVPFFYITLYATSHKLVREGFAPYVVTLLNAGSIFGRIVPNALADRFGSLNLLICCMTASAVLNYGWLGVGNMGGLVVYVLLYGAFTGGVVGLTPSVFTSLAPDLRQVGTRMGMGFMVCGVAILIGTPIAGQILGADEQHARWSETRLYSALSLTVATAFYTASRYLLWKKDGGLLKA
ncbi:major facilitator superfamily domain-containing protein [Cladorrhinum samala]|uniref:Major facilitator superfamily domain-containing protein n=1 Tax=Cladorrhinum samala TaxID=585594 RepID=A0AAV9HP66_9PEZI|nr:major facilitator superfamily domain-containing protein [Cladorrhinum samala]